MSRKMECPRCHKSLEEFKTEGIVFDFCSEGCKGIWCDQGELAAFVETKSDLPKGPLDKESELSCTKCDVPMKKRFYSGEKTEVDYCPQCRGVWMDFKELGAIQKQAIHIDAKGRLQRVFEELESKGHRVGIAKVSKK